MHKTDLASAGAFMAVAAIFMIGAWRFGISSRTSDGVPGAGFFPFIIGLIVLGLNSAQVVLWLKGKGEGKPSFALADEQRDNPRALFVTIAALVGLLVLWRLIFFEAAALLFCLAMNHFYGRGKLFNLVFSLLLVGLIHLFFARFLYIQFTL
ncbi:MAG: tripartite tricarboxylate transporter TctB family protein [Planctomycetota bacterium]|jgi:hypothetical protein|nr:tripartite tricarboxylate transporter TctB family protein [Planctomycetota bacterium]